NQSTHDTDTSTAQKKQTNNVKWKDDADRSLVKNSQPGRNTGWNKPEAALPRVPRPEKQQAEDRTRMQKRVRIGEMGRGAKAAAGGEGDRGNHCGSCVEHEPRQFVDQKHGQQRRQSRWQSRRELVHA